MASWGQISATTTNPDLTLQARYKTRLKKDLWHSLAVQHSGLLYMKLTDSQTSNDIFFLKNIFLFERLHCVIYIVMFFKWCKVLVNWDCHPGTTKKILQHLLPLQKFSLLLTHIHRNSHIFSNTALATWYYSNSFFCSAFCQSHFLCISCHL